ncbi:hypothetical protein C9374_000040 [Naegleria lovaniensis]|uniref:Uncharacterized protein n=1 Tax=Naegleria lovaniensis TaxID=51637 RepID=A0AA88KPG7_NAELO|nr:uncharacterized protein C9374_000040 [Naegleria lovaniensis]KAG2388601.1 hypothetical protein C9374_000040 [Naegleria lovaniensis]
MTQPKESEAEKQEEADCLDTCMASPISCLWIHDLGDKLHPVVSVILYTLLCPVTMPCLCTVGALVLCKTCVSLEDDEFENRESDEGTKKGEQRTKSPQP